MAKCPNCNKSLHIWNIKAECPHCTANIPNHNWEGRLEEDSVAREKAFYKMHSNISKLNYSVLGTPPSKLPKILLTLFRMFHIYPTLRFNRFLFSFLPILGYVVPLGSINYTCEDGTIIAADTVNAIALFTKDTFKIGDILSKVTGNFDIHNNLIMTFVLFVASLLFGVIGFFAIPVIFGKFKQPVTLICHAISLACYTGAALQLNGQGGDIASIKWGVYFGIALFAIAFILDIILLIKKIAPLDGKYVPDANKDLLQAEYAESIGEPFVALKETTEDKTEIKEEE